MTDFNHILNWRLLNGSHDFPGPNGGTCINEAAIVAAGFEYKAVTSYEDCPPCFSPVLSAILISANDQMPDDLRNELLMPFVVRLSGSRDTDEVEIRRARYIAVETVRRILPIALRAANQTAHADACAAVEAGDTKEHAAYAANAAANAAYAAANAAYAAYAANTASAAANAAYAAYAANTASAANAAYAAYAASAASAAKREIWTIMTDIIDAAFCLGNQAEPMDTAIIVERMDRIRVTA